MGVAMSKPTIDEIMEAVRFIEDNSFCSALDVKKGNYKEAATRGINIENKKLHIRQMIVDYAEAKANEIINSSSKNSSN
jgi:hypothetical protein